MSRIYITDVDFTLLRSDKSLGTYSRNAIEQFHDNDILFTLATARSVYSLKPLLGSITLPLPIIEFNGGYITDYTSYRPKKIFDLDSEVVKGIWDIGSAYDHQPVISVYDGSQKVYPPPNPSKGIQQYFDEQRKANDPRLQQTMPFEEIVRNKVMAMTFIGKEKKIHTIKNQIPDRYTDSISYHYYENKYTPGLYWLTIHDRLSTKEHAIKSLLEQEDLHDHELIVFGDDVNDIGMMLFADTAIAVANAKSEVKEVADIIIDSNDDEAVCRYILANENLS